MRLALGYANPLPFPIDYAPHSEQMCVLVGQCFPNHTVYVFTDEKVVESIDLPSNVIYGGNNATGYSLDDYLWAFSYMPDTESKRAHFVVGSPVVYPGMVTHQGFAVQLKGKTDGNHNQ